MPLTPMPCLLTPDPGFGFDKIAQRRMELVSDQQLQVLEETIRVLSNPNNSTSIK